MHLRCLCAGGITAQLFHMVQELRTWRSMPRQAHINHQHVHSNSSSNVVMNIFENFIDLFGQYEHYIDINTPNEQPVSCFI
jgi:hypothetical protein